MKEEKGKPYTPKRQIKNIFLLNIQDMLFLTLRPSYIGKCTLAFGEEEKKLKLIILNHRPFSHYVY